eukprot:3819274-Rhodomonas_salina.2
MQDSTIPFQFAPAFPCLSCRERAALRVSYAQSGTAIAHSVGRPTRCPVLRSSVWCHPAMRCPVLG